MKMTPWKEMPPPLGAFSNIFGGDVLSPLGALGSQARIQRQHSKRGLCAHINPIVPINFHSLILSYHICFSYSPILTHILSPLFNHVKKPQRNQANKRDPFSPSSSTPSLTQYKLHFPPALCSQRSRIRLIAPNPRPHISRSRRKAASTRARCH